MISPESKFENQKSKILSRSREQGIALVITLILLSVITFMAITFLVVSRTDKGSVSATTEQARSANAASSGVERAKAELIAAMLASGDQYNIHMWVSTNYINGNGFDPAKNASFSSPTNVNYDYTTGGAALTPAQRLQNIANLLYAPRLPVYITNRAFANSNEFRFYVDLNRNRRFDPTGLLPVKDTNGNYFDTNGVLITTLPAPGVVSNNFIGDPQWIGILEKTPYAPSLFDPNLAAFTHSSTNRGVARYAYMVIPVSDTMDINFIHNNTKQRSLNGEGFFRNQGVGTWEINLASFLVDLNTNQWSIGYQYDPSMAAISFGTAFADASSILSFRYNQSYKNLLTIPALFQAKGVTAFEKDGIDGLTDGPIMDSLVTPPENDTTRITAKTSFWAGTDNPTHLFSSQDLVDPTKVGAFANRLAAAGTNVDSYNQYTFYRLFSQIGTDSAPEPADTMNLNYDNLVYTDPVRGVRTATNFHSWQALDFFTNAASRMLTVAGFDPKFIKIDKIPIYPTNLYSASVHRILQQAANLFDATTNRDALSGTNIIGFPSVFRPLFQSSGNVIFISGFEEVTDAQSIISAKSVDLNDAQARQTLQSRDMVYGVPLVIGAKRGFPNFNKYVMENSFQIQRRLQFIRPTPTTLETNQMFVVSVTNSYAVQAWNSYSNIYRRNLQMLVGIDITASLTNQSGSQIFSNRVTTGYATNIISWSGFLPNADNNPNLFKQSVQIPIMTNFTFMPSSAYFEIPAPGFSSNRLGQFERTKRFPVSDWFLNLQSRVTFLLVDTAGNNRIIDYVNLNSAEDPVDIASSLNSSDADCKLYKFANLWCTNRVGTPASDLIPTFGVMNQIFVGLNRVTDPFWDKYAVADPGNGYTKEKSQGFFYHNLMGVDNASLPPGPYYTSNVFYAPYAPVATRFTVVDWEANDPLVHYTIGDLQGPLKTNVTTAFAGVVSTTRLNRPNDNYAPWGKNNGNFSDNVNAETWQYNLGLKDPGITRSDDWDFPTNKFPNVGWIGRVHRGTPWQTIDLKAVDDTEVTDATRMGRWRDWTGNKIGFRNYGQVPTNVVPLNAITNDSYFTHPIHDRKIFDLFSTSFDANSARGRMSVNQTNLASWSALLAGVVVLSNSSAGGFTTNVPIFIEPVSTSTNAPLTAILQSIMAVRAKTTFSHIGDVLAARALTLDSPFLDLTSPKKYTTINDAEYERIPQQIMGFLKVDPPRFVIYSYGQSLKPADRSLVTSGPYFGICINYQITAETTTRAVVRIEGAPANPRVVVESFNILPPD